MDIFGNTDPRKLPEHMYSGAIHIDNRSAIRGNPQNQNYSVCPRHWYIDATFECTSCHRDFTWTAQEQRAWFENYHFWIDSQPRLCKCCMADRKLLVSLRKEYDSIVADAQPMSALELKRRVVASVQELESAFTSLPEKMIETKSLYERQIRKTR